MITEGHAKPADAEHGKEKRDLEPVDPEIAKVNRNGRESEENGAAKEQTGRPIDPVDREMPN